MKCSYICYYHGNISNGDTGDNVDNAAVNSLQGHNFVQMLKRSSVIK